MWLRELDPKYIDWSDALTRRGWTESLLRDYSDFINWDLANIMIGDKFTLDFAREIRHKFSVEDGSVLTYRGKVIL